MIYPERRVTWSHSPVSLEFLLLERPMKYREAQGVEGRARGGGILRRAAELSCTSTSAELLHMWRTCDTCSFVWLHFSSLMKSSCVCVCVCASSSTAAGADRLACQLLTSMFVCPSPCVCVFVLCWEQGGDKFSALAPDWRQWPFILHCPT